MHVWVYLKRITQIYSYVDFIALTRDPNRVSVTVINKGQRVGILANPTTIPLTQKTQHIFNAQHYI